MNSIELPILSHVYTQNQTKTAPTHTLTYINQMTQKSFPLHSLLHTCSNLSRSSTACPSGVKRVASLQNSYWVVGCGVRAGD